MINSGDKALADNPDFFRFLKEEGVFERWLKNRRWFKKNAKNVLHPLFDYATASICISRPDLLYKVASSFIWDRTPEGDDFWFALSNKWTDLVREKENEF